MSDKSGDLNSKLKNTEDVLDERIASLEKLLESHESKVELTKNINEMEAELEDDMVNLGELLEKLPP